MRNEALDKRPFSHANAHVDSDLIRSYIISLCHISVGHIDTSAGFHPKCYASFCDLGAVVWPLRSVTWAWEILGVRFRRRFPWFYDVLCTQKCVNRAGWLCLLYLLFFIPIYIPNPETLDFSILTCRFSGICMKINALLHIFIDSSVNIPVNISVAPRQGQFRGSVDGNGSGRQSWVLLQGLNVSWQKVTVSTRELPRHGAVGRMLWC